MLEQSTVSDDQPSQESTTQDTQDQVNEQPEATGGEEPQNAKPVEYEIDGEKFTAEQLKEFKQGYMRQEDYTKKTQELAEEKRKLGRQELSTERKDDLDPEVKTALETLKKAGVVTKEDLAMMKAQEEDQKNFRKLLKRNPELKAHEKALKQIGLTDNRAWEDIVVDYGFLSQDKLSKAKASKPIVGTKEVTPAKTKAIADMSPQEYAEWKKQNLGNGLRSIN